MIGLHSHPKNGGYWFKRGIPERVRAAFDGKSTWYENLKTKDRRLAESRYHEAALRFDELLKQAEHQFSHQQLSAANPAVLTGLVHRWREREQWRRAEMVIQGDPMPGWSQFLKEAQLVDLPHYKPKVEAPEAFMARIAARSAYVDEVVDELCREATLLLPSDHPGRQVLARMIGDAWRAVLELEDRWRSHDFTALPTLPPESASELSLRPFKAAPEPPRTGPTLSQALEDWKTGGGARNAKTPAPRTVTEGSTAVRRFKELHGDLPIRAIKKDHARELREALSKVPVRLTLAQRSMSLPQLLAAEIHGTRPTVQTLNKQMNLLSAILAHADVEQGRFDDIDWSNPFRLQYKLRDGARRSYEPFTDKELNRLFSSPVFALGERPKRGRGETAKWAPLVALLHGLRRRETLQLWAGDVRYEPDTGTWLLFVTPSLEGDEEGHNADANVKRVKTAGSKRNVPLHPALLKLGFADFVSSRLAEVGPEGSLWPGFEDPAKFDSRANRWAEWFGRYLAEHVVASPTKKFHSFRGTFLRCAADSGMAERHAYCFTGHALQGVAQRSYGRLSDEHGTRDRGVSSEVLVREVAKVHFAGLNQLLQNSSPFAGP